MNFDEYKIEFLNSLRADASVNNTDTASQFLDYTFSLLQDMNIIDDPNRTFFGKSNRKNRIMQIDGYSYDYADNSLSLFILDFEDLRDRDNLTNSYIDTLTGRLSAFLEEACYGRLSEYCDDSDEILKIATQIKYRIDTDDDIKKILKIKMHIISNAKLSPLVKVLKTGDFHGIIVDIQLWTLDRLFDIAMASNNEPIVINMPDFGVEGLPCLKADMSQGATYEAYLAIIPGKLLSDIYIKHGSRLLEGNVRSFLSSRGNVNKSIRNTIIKEPTNFFTYNNGIALTSSSVSVEKKGNILLITRIEDLQIINGGQTTASLANAVLKKDNQDLNNIFVPLKLTVIPYKNEGFLEDTYHDMIQKISKYANSQNKVTDADFFSNSPFHIIMEKMSKKYFAPPVNGKPYPTIWYYERSRGKYEQEQFKLTKSERDKFSLKSPKEQVITKEKLAKYMNAMDCLPYIVSQGSNNNMKEFGNKINKIYQLDKEKFNEAYFHKAVCAAIIFTEVDKLVVKQPWYQKGGYKLNIVPYTIAKIFSSIPNGKAINFDMIWKKQALYPSFVVEAEKIMKLTNDFIVNSGGVIVTEYCKSKDTWEKFRNIPYRISNEYYNDLIDEVEILVEQDRAKKEEHFNSGIDVEIQVVKYGSDYWNRLLQEGTKKKLLDETEISLLVLGSRIGSPNARVPSLAQAKRMMLIRKKLDEEGIIV